MKTKIFFIALLAIVLLSATQCEKEKDLNTLPPETQEGKNTFGCLINGEIYVKGSGPIFQLPIGAGYSKKRKTLTFGAYLNPIGYMYLETINPIINGQNIAHRCFYNSEGLYFGGRDIGSIILTRFDTINLIISGRFTFNGQQSDPNLTPIGDSTIRVTEGRFDIKLNIYE